jgi:hypothetical protein
MNKKEFEVWYENAGYKHPYLTICDSRVAIDLLFLSTLRHGEIDITLDVTEFDKITVTYSEISKELYVMGLLTFDQAKKLLTT